MHEVRGVVAKAKGEPVSIETVLVPDPGPGEALVAIKACGVCHTDLHYREGGINDDFPFLLGHEAAGIVEAVGPDVTDVAPGDYVILNWRAVCGQCRSCRKGKPWYCFSTFNATQKMTLADGTVHVWAALGGPPLGCQGGGPDVRSAEPMHEVRGVVAKAKGEPVSIETVLVPDPGPGEALVAVKACGVCHTDLHYREGGINDDFPFLLGHEAAGIVEAVGPDVTDWRPMTL